MRVVVAALVAVIAASSGSRGQEAPASVDLETFRGWFGEISNAGRWGAADQLGTLNLITDAKRRTAAGSIEDGVSVSLSRPLKPGENANAIEPMRQEYIVSPADGGVTWLVDRMHLVFHGWAFTHLDGLSHAGFDGHLYNGASVDQMTTNGATELGVEQMASGIVSRGVLVDVPRLKGVPYLEPGSVITADDLEAWEKKAGHRVEPGDVLLIRTGRWARERAVGPWKLAELAAGPHPSIARWLKSRGVAAIGGDGSNERYPSVVDQVSDPLHQLALVGMGMPILDNLDLEAVAEEASRRSRWTFFFVVAPLPLPGGSGSPVNPLAVF